jgi:type I restriction enzyme S subunit
MSSKYKLGDLCTIGSSKRVHLADYVETGVPFFRSKEIIELSNGQNISEPLYISNEQYNEIKTKFPVPKKNDILITSVGTIGISYLVKDENFYFKDGNLTWLRNINENIISIDFLTQWLKSNFFKRQILNNNIGAVQKAITIDYLKKVNITLPDLPSQQKIASILSTLDAKIELNNKINTELEAMAKTLYDYWFVQFDFPNENGKPYKSSGGEMVWSEELKREIPIGWEVNTLGETCEIYQPQTISEKDCVENGKYFVHGSNGIIGKYDRYNHEDSEIIVSCRGDCGNIHRTLPKMWITGNAMVFKMLDKTIHNEFLYQALRHSGIKNISSGSVQGQITRTNVSPLKIIIPKKKIIDKFSKIAKHIVSKKLLINKEKQTLSHLRDFLLPMLMNGQVVIR